MEVQPIYVVSEPRRGLKIGPLLLLGAFGIGAYFFYDAYRKGTWPFNRTCVEGDDYCGQDGYVYLCKNNQWEKQATTCVPGSTGSTSSTECQPNATRSATCWDGSSVVVATCVNGKWQETGNVCPPAPTTISSVTFTLLEYETLNPAKNVKCTLDGVGTAYTDSYGKARFTNVPLGKYKLWCLKSGWHVDTYGVGYMEDYVLADLSSSALAGQNVDYASRYRFINMKPILPSTVKLMWATEPPNTITSDGTGVNVKLEVGECYKPFQIIVCSEHKPCLVVVRAFDQWGDPATCMIRMSVRAVVEGDQYTGFTYPGDKHVHRYVQVDNASELQAHAWALAKGKYSEQVLVTLGYTDPRTNQPVEKTMEVGSFSVVERSWWSATWTDKTCYECDACLDNTYFDRCRLGSMYRWA